MWSYVYVLKYLFKSDAAYATYIIHSPRTLCIRHVHYSFTAYIVHTSRTLFIRHVHCSYATYIIHSPRTLCIHHVHFVYVTYIDHTSRTLFIGHVYSEYTAYTITSIVHFFTVRLILYTAYITRTYYTVRRCTFNVCNR